MNKRFSKTKLSLALASVLVGGLATTSAQALQINEDGLGNAIIFPYYTVNNGWQTFFRIINTSDNVVVVKVRFREAANTREVLDFEVALSPHDMWTGWTDPSGANNGNPGIRTNDTSCVFPLPDSSAQPGESWETIDANSNLIAADFKDRAFTGSYADGSPQTSLQRMSEGHFEVIGVAEIDPSFDTSGFTQDVTHAADGKPGNCQDAFNIYNDQGHAWMFSDDQNNVGVSTIPGNILAANAYLINTSAGQGAAYDPVVFQDCRTSFTSIQADPITGWMVNPLWWGAIQTDTEPDLDSCNSEMTIFHPYDPTNRWGTTVFVDFSQTDPNNAANTEWATWNQLLADGTPSVPPGTVTVYQADLFPLAGAGAPGPSTAGDGAYTATDTFSIDLNGDQQCTGTYQPGATNAELSIPETDVPQAVYAALQSPANPQFVILAPSGNCDYWLVDSTTGAQTIVEALTNTTTNSTAAVGRIKQKGLLGTMNVIGGVDWASYELMRRSVINEWAASNDPNAVVTDYYTQWVLTFPTKHYYVDLFTDPNATDDISPTLASINSTLAFAPFTNPYAGGSCEPYQMELWNREERQSQFTSPAPGADPLTLCWETNVVNFNDRYTQSGLASNFSITIPTTLLPTDFDGETSTRGWARMTFIGQGTGNFDAVDGNWTNGGLWWWWDLGGGFGFGGLRAGLPVTGFLFTNYETGNAATTHATISSHKYTRQEAFVSAVDAGTGVPTATLNQ